jgi:hypothetical protein
VAKVGKAGEARRSEQSGSVAIKGRQGEKKGI